MATIFKERYIDLLEKVQKRATKLMVRGKSAGYYDARCYDHEFVIASPIVYDHGCVPIRQRHHGCDPIGAVIIDVIHYDHGYD